MVHVPKQSHIYYKQTNTEETRGQMPVKLPGSIQLHIKIQQNNNTKLFFFQQDFFNLSANLTLASPT